MHGEGCSMHGRAVACMGRAVACTSAHLLDRASGMFASTSQLKHWLERASRDRMTGGGGGGGGVRVLRTGGSEITSGWDDLGGAKGGRSRVC